MEIPADLNDLSDDDLEQLIESARLIIIRRAAVTAIPAQIEELAREYRENGGDQATLTEAITEQESQ